MRIQLIALVAVCLSLTACDRQAPDKMSFFVISKTTGEGGNLGGLAGADAHCQQLAEAAGSKKTWRAYLSVAPEGGRPAIHARDRIGRGPWFNSRGEQIAANLDDLHGPNNRIGRNTAMIETAARTNFSHDILTGSNADGTLADGDATCRSWTSTIGHAVLGHSDRQGRIGAENSQSWNSAHLSDGCTLAALQARGGSGLFYCFAID